MSLKGTMRSLAAAQRRMERQERQRQRELERQRKELARMEELERALFEFEEFENYIDVITSIHKDCGPEWDWNEVGSMSRPIEPERKNTHEMNAQRDYEEFKPGMADKLLRKVDAKKEALKAEIDKAGKRDDEEYKLAIADHLNAVSEWEDQRNLSRRILSGEPDAFVEAINAINPFGEISGLGSSAEFSCSDSRIIEAVFFPHGEDVIPKESKSLFKSGRLSTKQMPKSRFYELYQDYVCGCVLRLARELFSMLPIQMALVTAVSPLLNTATGHMEEQPILSVAIPRKTLETLNFAQVDPSDSMDNFVHNMKFLKTKGFQAVQKLDSSSIQLVE